VHYRLSTRTSSSLAPPPDRLVEPQRGAGRGSDAQMCRVASVGIEVACAAIEDSNFAGSEMKRRYRARTWSGEGGRRA
jgi:hypothetical protein